MSENRIRVDGCKGCAFFKALYCTMDGYATNYCGASEKVESIDLICAEVDRGFDENCPLKKGPVVVEVDHE